MTGFDIYLQYIPLKAHFTSKYDYFKYNGKIKSANFGNWKKTAGRYFYGKLAAKYKDNFPEFVATTYLYGLESNWIGDLVDERFDKMWSEHQGYRRAMTRLFTDDVKFIFKWADKHSMRFQDVFKANNKVPVPTIYEMMIRGDVKPESVAILNDFMVFVDRTNCEHFICDEYKTAIKNYAGFMPYDKKKLSEAFKKVLDNWLD